MGAGRLAFSMWLAVAVGTYEISFPQSILWGVLSCMAAFAIGIVRERASGSWLRLRVAPLTRAPILLGILA